MEISFLQRQLLSNLYKHGYIGNWYRSPNKTFLKIYLLDEKTDVHMRIQFDISLSVMDMMFDDPTLPLFQRSRFEEKFSNVIQAVKEIIPNAFKNYAVDEVRGFDFADLNGDDPNAGPGV